MPSITTYGTLLTAASHAGSYETVKQVRFRVPSHQRCLSDSLACLVLCHQDHPKPGKRTANCSVRNVQCFGKQVWAWLVDSGVDISSDCVHAYVSALAKRVAPPPSYRVTIRKLEVEA